MTDPGSLLLQHGHPKHALPLLMESLLVAPNDTQLMTNLSACERQLGHFEAAKEWAMQALRRDKNLGAAWNNLGMVFEDLGEFTNARDAYEAAYTLMPESQLAAINYAYSLMRFERFEEAWPHWMYGRFMTAWKPVPGIPIWQGEDNLAGARILVNRDGGYGDGIMFARWLGALFQRGAKEVWYRVWARMVPLFRSQPWAKVGELTILPDDITLPVDKIDLQCALMSLPALLGVKTLADVPEGIRITPDRIISCLHLDSPGDPFACRVKRVGLCFRAEENGTARKHRSIPEMALEPLHAVPGVRWYSLCPRGKDLYRHDAFVTPEWITDLTAEMTDWDQTAAFMANMDLIITVDTAVAHLAGAMGLPTWVLVPKRSDWKMFMGREDSPWYSSWRIMRQDDPLSWDSLIARVAEELTKL